jgi:hypothetical protein
MAQWKTSVWINKINIKVNATFLPPSQIAKLFDVKASKPQQVSMTKKQM